MEDDNPVGRNFFYCVVFCFALSFSLALFSATAGLLSGNVLSHCKPGCVFMNVGRGDIIDLSTLEQALDEKWISGAILDVFPEEPLPASSSLWKRENVIVTPHVAAATRVHGIRHCCCSLLCISLFPSSSLSILPLFSLRLSLF